VQTGRGPGEPAQPPFETKPTSLEDPDRALVEVERMRAQPLEPEYVERVGDERADRLTGEPTPADGRGEPIAELSVVRRADLQVIDPQRADHLPGGISDGEGDLHAASRDLHPVPDPFVR
jgi:hypothetical protein